MAIDTKYNLPNNGSLADERDKYQLLYDNNPVRSTTGNVNWTSTTSGATYNTTGTDYDNQGETGLMNLIFYGDSAGGYTNPKLVEYVFVASEINGLQTDVSTNASNISSNTGSISSNTGDINTNISDIATNTGNISTNTGNISSNTGNISGNTSDINTLESIGDIVAKTVSGNILTTDADKFLKCTNASAITLTIQPNTTISIVVGTEISLTQYGAGSVTLAQGSGVTITSTDSLKKISAQYASVALKKIATDEWLLVGSLV